MLKINNAQVLKFKEHFVSDFENELLIHVQNYFQGHYQMIGEDGIRNTIRYCLKKCKQYKFTTKRNICLYLNNMLMLGSNFDDDPQYPWGRTILKDVKFKDSVRHIDDISSNAMEVFEAIAGSDNKYINRYFLGITQQKDKLFQSLSDSNLKLNTEILKEWFPQKYKTIKEQNIQKMVLAGYHFSEKYRIIKDSNIAIYIFMMFTGGSGFDTDPQYSPITGILNSDLEEDQKGKDLFDKTIEMIQHFLKSENS